MKAILMNGLVTRVASILAGLCLASALPAAQRDSSLTESSNEQIETSIAIKALKVENLKLREQLEAAEKSVVVLQKSLAIADSESEVFRRQTTSLKLKLEALGLDSVGGNTSKLEQRLLKAVSDLKLADDERKMLREALVRLSESVLAYQKVTSTSNPDARLALEAEMRGAAKALGITPEGVAAAPGAAATITDGMVISVKDDLALVVANFGSTQGVQLGMPFEVIRNNRPIGTVRVVDVREKIAGAVIQSLFSDKEKIAVGDHLRVEVRN